MRVLSVGNMYPPHHLGGYELMWRSATAELRGRGAVVRVLTTDYSAPSPDPAIAEAPDVHRELRWYWSDHDFPPIGVVERWRLERHNLDVLDRHLEDFRPDVVCWWAMGGMSMSMIERVRLGAVPAVGVVVDDWMLYGPSVDAWQRAFRRPGRARIAEAVAGVPTRIRLGEAAHWIFVSQTVRRHAIKAGWPPRSSEIAHAGINPSLFPPAEPQAWRGRLLYVGRIDPRKGIATAVEALAELPDSALRIVGSGDEHHLSELRDAVARLGLAGRVSFEQHPRDELAAIYAQADTVLFPVTWDEPWGLVPLEAMSVGRPVIATGTGGSGEYLRDGENCLLFSPRSDARALAAAVRALATDDGLRNRLRAGGRTTAGRFTEAAFNDAVARALAEASRE